jgi:antitoxin component YwqK of YwqJK toxin-antitoxin module
MTWQISWYENGKLEQDVAAVSFQTNGEANSYAADLGVDLNITGSFLDGYVHLIYAEGTNSSTHFFQC